MISKKCCGNWPKNCNCFQKKQKETQNKPFKKFYALKVRGIK